MCGRGRWINRSAVGTAVSLFLLSCAGVFPVHADEAAIPAAPVAKPEFNGRLRLQYDYRAQGDASDTDFYGYWSGGGRSFWNGRLDLYSSGRVHRDLDSESTASQADDPYVGVSDAAGVLESRMFLLYADLHDRKNRTHVRAGRQYIEDADYLHVDGVRATVFEWGALGGGAFYGKPVSFYTSVSGDDAWGVFVAGRPWAGNRMRLTYSRYESTTGSDGNYHLDVVQTLSDAARVRAQASVLNGDFRMGRLDCSYFAEDGETDLLFGGSRWGEFDAETRAFSPFYDVLGPQEPYTYAYARLTRVVLPHVAVSPGVSARFSEGEGFGNRDYVDYDLALTYEPVRAFSTCLSFDYWDVDGGEGFLGMNGDIRYRRGKLWELSLGSSYSKHTYLTYTDFSYAINGGQTSLEQGTLSEKTPYTYTYYVRAKWSVRKHLTLKLQCDVEDDSDASDLAYRGRASIEVRL